MILVVGSSRDRVYPVLTGRLREAGAAFRTLDEDDGEHPFEILREGDRRRILGQGCTGEAPVGCVFVRHAVARTLDPVVTARLGAWQVALNALLAEADCPVVNPPGHAFSNYAKVYQLALLAAAGFVVPRTLMTNLRDAAEAFAAAEPGEVIFKGASNMMTLAQVLGPENVQRLAHLRHAPVVFQERIPGHDVRVHVIGTSWIATRLASGDADYRRAAFAEEAVEAGPAELPAGLGERCVAVTRALGLRTAGLDFRVEPDGRHVVLELNPFPQFTFYERLGGQPITAALAGYLMGLDAAARPESARILV
jgi:glutathione synthase/RimK-type ligase-like ATP-grasp enzyme